MDTQDVFDSIIANSGGTFACRSGIRPVNFSDGYMVSLEKREAQWTLDSFDHIDLVQYIEAQWNYLGGIGYYLGAWIDGDIVYLDVSIKLDSREFAIRKGRKHNQLAIWDNNAGKAIAL